MRIFLLQVDEAYERGDYEQARISSEEAKCRVIGSILAGIVLLGVIAVSAYLRIKSTVDDINAI